MTRFNDDTRDELREVIRAIFAPRRDRTAGNVPLYDERPTPRTAPTYCDPQDLLPPRSSPRRCRECGGIGGHTSVHCPGRWGDE